MDIDGARLMVGTDERVGAMDIVGRLDTVGDTEGTDVGSRDRVGEVDGTVLGLMDGASDGRPVGFCDGTIVGTDERLATGVGYAMAVGCDDELGLEDGAVNVPLRAHSSGISIHTSGLLNTSVSRSSCCRSLLKSRPVVLDSVDVVLPEAAFVVSFSLNLSPFEPLFNVSIRFSVEDFPWNDALLFPI
jgi:hypothetical protein